MIKTDTMTGVGMGQMQIGLEDVELMQKKGEDDFTTTSNDVVGTSICKKMEKRRKI